MCRGAAVSGNSGKVSYGRLCRSFQVSINNGSRRDNPKKDTTARLVEVVDYVGKGWTQNPVPWE